MIQVELTSEEVAFLRRLLELEGGELGMEISATDAQGLREALKRDRTIVRSLIAKLDQPEPIIVAG
ncbi:MAG: hypothetical protein ACOZNI_14170 [Myxococcota bacterium]